MLQHYDFSLWHQIFCGWCWYWKNLRKQGTGLNTPYGIASIYSGLIGRHVLLLHQKPFNQFRNFKFDMHLVLVTWLWTSSPILLIFNTFLMFSHQYFAMYLLSCQLAPLSCLKYFLDSGSQADDNINVLSNFPKGLKCLDFFINHAHVVLSFKFLSSILGQYLQIIHVLHMNAHNHKDTSFHFCNWYFCAVTEWMDTCTSLIRLYNL